MRYLMRCHNAANSTFVVQIGQPGDYVVDIDRGTGFWGLPADMPENRWGRSWSWTVELAEHSLCTWPAHLAVGVWQQDVCQQHSATISRTVWSQHRPGLAHATTDGYNPFAR